MRFITRSVVLGAAAFAALLAYGATVHAQPLPLNACAAGKVKCATKKAKGLLGCFGKAAKGGFLDPACLQKSKDKFDGGAAPEKGCFAKLETKPPCLSVGDTNSMESKIDAFITDVVDELYSGGIDACAAGKLKCVTKKAKGILGCFNKAIKGGLAVDAACVQKSKDKFDGGAVPAKGCFEALEAKGGCNTLDDTAALEAKVDAFVADVVDELISGKDLQNHRCTGNTRTHCNTNADCSVATGTCEFYFGTYLPLSAGGVSTCVENKFIGTISGTANVDTGTTAGIAFITSKVFSGPTADAPCPQCLGDLAANDGVRGGTCSSGANSGLSCDVSGRSVNPVLGPTSLDCPPLGGGVIATLPIDLSNTSGTQTKTLSAASPNCRASGFTSLKCFCDTCNNAAATPCSSNADCTAVGATICGGKRCIGGTNNGAACTTGTECPGGACSVPGLATAPNQCLDATCSADGGNEGTCAAGPFEQFCFPNETFRGCIADAECGFPGDTCSFGKNRDCYTDNGLSGNSVNGTGVADPPVNHSSDPTLAALFCIGPTSASAVNSVAGLPGLGRLELGGHAEDNGTASACPTMVDFVGTSTGGILDAGWTGQSHDSQVVTRGTVTVSFTGCAGTTPPCGVCTYTGPIANPNSVFIP